MIGSILGVPQSTVRMVNAAGWDTKQGGQHASDTHLAEPNVVITNTGQIPAPTVNTVPRLGFPGLRAIVNQLVRTGIPLVPQGPPKVSRMGQGYHRAGRTPKPISKVQQYVPAPTIEQTGDWWTFAGSAPGGDFLK